MLVGATRLCGRYPRTRIFRRLVTKPAVETDECGIPIKPTWSVNELLSSYPTPSISSATLRRLHELSALVPPEEGTPEHETMRRELERLVKLVEAVKLVKFDCHADDTIPDGRIWAQGKGIPLKVDISRAGVDETRGKDLLKLASRTLDGMYVVETNRRR
ncbi:hypothetical protein SCLCIDRAFT_1209981 [Scleroderma citrinum Foug A]|uniref:Uncharacterized protein n=1 Tax=Scleroderma citrinum Foug A TaxID=1036808 RepID=A0A0C3A2F7_9AGAM|nr:hypothetical protein SCLCIDRAFT_1209981 [Scleroderma citrinum Foug A]